ncbi:hypothetical protein DSO57_1032156 [Entomophthora muscae]|uniref:Uncharacterized protein n=1 Tax=Entomophthora muscae TaxID=34485 RepID=A0ACC2TYL7_9FUNG|nr:hypothetical protein DSO57_1032156 [Entomophthora muscae]
MTYVPGTPPEITKCPDYTSGSPPYHTLSPASLAIQRRRLEMAFQMEACLDINESIHPIYDPPRFVAEDEDVSSEEEELGPMDMPPPRNFKKLYTRTPLFWKEVVNSYKVPEDDPLFMNTSIRQKGYFERKFINDSLKAGFDDLLNSRIKIHRLTSSAYDLRHTPFSLPKLSQRVRGHKTVREIKKDLERPIFPMMPGFHTRACSTRKRKYELITACDGEDTSLPAKQYHDWEDDLFPAAKESLAKEFPNQLEDPRYIEREKQRKAYLLEQEKANAPWNLVPFLSEDKRS